MSLFGTKEKQEIASLQAENQNILEKNAALENELENLKKQNSEFENEIENLKERNRDLLEKAQSVPEEIPELDSIKREIKKNKAYLTGLKATISDTEDKVRIAKKSLIDVSDAVQLQDFGLYTPHYNLMHADEYKAKMMEIRALQKDMVRNGSAVTGSQTWTVNGNASKGKKMVADMQKLLLRAFNAECDDVIEHVKYNNVETAEKRITSSQEAITKLGTIMGVSIVPSYYRLKLEELYLAFEYAQKKQEEKEEQREARAQMREEAKLAREIEEARKKLEKEQQHYNNALAKVNAQLDAASEEDRAAIEEKKSIIESQLQKIDKEFADVDYRQANQRAGYVYIISNIGAFGENVYKIGMTRRLDPQDRVDELGDASVPFNFDVHAMIFSDDAPKLEAALHNAFADRKLNFVNQRREFFNVTLEEIKKVVKENFDKSVEFVELAPAQQYRESILLRKKVQQQDS